MSVYRVSPSDVKANTRSGASAAQRGLEVLVHRDHGEVVVVQARPAQLGVLEVEAQRLHQVQLGAGHRGEADGVAGVAGDFGGVEEDSKHVVQPLGA